MGALVQSDIRRLTIECDRVGGINLGQGICDLPTHPLVKQGAVDAINNSQAIYTHARGLIELRRAISAKLRLYEKAGVPEYWVVDPKTGAISLFVLKKRAYEQLVVDPKGFIASPLLKKKLRIVVHPWSFEILEA